MALVNKVFMGATGKTKFARALHNIVFIESIHIFSFLYVACMLVLSGHGTGKLSLSPWHPKFISHYSLTQPPAGRIHLNPVHPVNPVKKIRQDNRIKQDIILANPWFQNIKMQIPILLN